MERERTKARENDLQHETWDEAWLLAAADETVDNQEEGESYSNPEDNQVKASPTAKTSMKPVDEACGRRHIGPTLG